MSNVAGPFYITAAGQIASISTSDQSCVGVSVTGSFTGTLQPGVTIGPNGPNAPVNTQVTPYGSSTAQNTITAAGGFNANVAGTTTFQLSATSLSVGTAVVYLVSSPAHI
jgi:hypothetical protein